MLIVSCAVAVCCGLPASARSIVKVAGPAVVGAPLIAPLLALSASPAGSAEPFASDQVYGVVPPLPASCAAYGCPTMPAVSVEVVIASLAAAMVIESLAVAVCTGVAASLTCTVKVVLPAVVGVPAIAPSLFRVIPAGNEEPAESVQLYG